MILSRDRGLIFVHIPKTGGTSLARALEARASATDILIGDTPRARRRRGRVARLRGQARGRLWKHSTLADIDGLLTPGDIAAMFTVTLVRNPWDRMVSYYTWARTQSFDHPAVRLAKTCDFEGFVTAPETRAAWAAQPARHYMTAADRQEYARLSSGSSISRQRPRRSGSISAFASICRISTPRRAAITGAITATAPLPSSPISPPRILRASATDSDPVRMLLKNGIRFWAPRTCDTLWI